MSSDAVASQCPVNPARFDQHRATVEDAYAAYGELRASCPVAHSDAHGGYVLLSRYKDVRKAAIDWQTFSSAKGTGLPQDRTRPPLPALEMDPPEHGAWRKLYVDALAPAALRAMEPLVAEIADGLIDGFAADGSCDLVRQYCEPLPILGISRAIGLTGKEPERIRTLALNLTETAPDPAAHQQAIGRLGEFILSELHDRRTTPRDDYLTTIARAQVDGRPMSDYEASVFMIGFLVAGHETTASAMTGLFSHVLGRPDLQRRLLEDDRALDAAIEEAVRLTSPFHGFSRTATRDVEVAGTVIPEGEVVRLSWASANRDADVFADPDRFDIDRPANTHLGFGIGRHVCAGAPFARIEMRIALRRLLTRLPDIAPVQSAPKWHFAGGMMTIPESFEVRFSPPT
ncbi:cytochrome P450 [Novosphingobium chloroacetimidivorans]|uniref:Cytochrome P450 n=1 Tax=Novosphingobium chloroacetimidivorans TaxID=1428314 RepID=A0A7W7K9F2_9SPHN|nr:cytochrome P450 [Novosphingobium chloroacetimidivorans]MBB4858672.1 cytochrome P450 [Novosphingobium chloroacetimidivorans]